MNPGMVTIFQNLRTGSKKKQISIPPHSFPRAWSCALIVPWINSQVRLKFLQGAHDTQSGAGNWQESHGGKRISFIAGRRLIDEEVILWVGLLFPAKKDARLSPR
jgi:hypothetical protein